ncbi:MAG: DUF6067 family protein [Rhodothermales bacterium]
MICSVIYRGGRHGLLMLFLALVIGTAGCRTASDLDTVRPAVLTNTIDGVPRVSGNWEPMLPAGERGRSWGNHRAVIVADSSADVLAATIPWRRQDDPKSKGLVLVDSASGLIVSNKLVAKSDKQSGVILFDGSTGGPVWYAYYFPYWTTGGYYPRLTYLTADSLNRSFPADASWISRARAAEKTAGGARVTRIESIDAFHSFFPMEIPASDVELRTYVAANPGRMLLFPEYRERPIRMRSALPRHWVVDRYSQPLSIGAAQNEYVTFQVGVYAPADSLESVSATVSDFTQGARTLSADAFTCFNLGGVDLDGDVFAKDVGVAAGTVQPLWFGVMIPENQSPGEYKGKVSIAARNVPAMEVPFSIVVIDSVSSDHGDSEPWKQTRLRWLDSKIGSDDYIIEPYRPVAVSGHQLDILGRTIVLGPTGLPERIESHFSADVSRIEDSAQAVLSRPVGLEVEVGERSEVFTSRPFEIANDGPDAARWEVSSASDNFDMMVHGTLEYDGMLDYKIALVARRQVDVSDIRLPLHYEREAAAFMLGLGETGRRRPERIDWKWQVEHHQEGVWLGAVNRGLQYVLRDDNYERPLNTNFYLSKPLNLPPSWYNEGRGGIRIRDNGSDVVADNYSGRRRMAEGDTLHFNVRFLITPFKPIDTESHFNTRFVHKYVPVDSVVAWGGTVVNIHHANEINPYINYPFYNLDKQAAYITEAHDKGVKVKLYYTIRELTYKAYELFPLRSLGYEVFNDGKGGGHSWLQEHLQDHYYAAWHAFRVDDAAILDKGTSRWTNYYVEGLNWLAANQKIDGLYLDDIAFSRETVKRMVTVLDRQRDGVVIDLHSANQFNPRDGYINSAMLYMEHFPFISRLWFGEYFDYSQGPDYWLTEVSGIPFGLMGEMLQDCGRPYRGMLYGMTTRVYGDCDPRPIWKLFDEFGVADASMRGYWLDSAPVRTGREDVLATSYVRDGSTLVVLASWAQDDVPVTLSMDWAQLGLDPSTVKVSVPSVAGLQSEARANVTGPIIVPADSGLFLLLEE